MADEYAAYIEERYQGEVFGEAFMRAMAEVRTDPDEVRKFRALEQLERETKEMLRPAVEESGRSTEPNQQKIEQAEEIRSGPIPCLRIEGWVSLKAVGIDRRVGGLLKSVGGWRFFEPYRRS